MAVNKNLSIFDSFSIKYCPVLQIAQFCWLVALTVTPTLWPYVRLGWRGLRRWAQQAQLEEQQQQQQQQAAWLQVRKRFKIA